MDKKIDVFLDRPRKLWFRHKDLRDAVSASGNRRMGDLLDDAFAGWPILLLHGLRHQDMRLTLDKCSEMIEAWADSGKPLNELQEVLIKGIEATGFIKIARPEDEPENPQNPTMTESSGT